MSKQQMQSDVEKNQNNKLAGGWADHRKLAGSEGILTPAALAPPADEQTNAGTTPIDIESGRFTQALASERLMHPPKCCCTSQSATFNLLASLNDPFSIVTPEDHLKAAGELLGVLFVVCGITTYVNKPGLFQDNPLMVRLGYSNPCITFDSHPASYVAQVLWPVVAYMNLQYCTSAVTRTLFKYRTNVTSLTKTSIGIGAIVLFAISTCIFGLVFVISPMGPCQRSYDYDTTDQLATGDVVDTAGLADKYMWLHTYFYLQYIACRLVIVVVTYYEAGWEKASRNSKIFLGIFAFCSIMIIVSAYVNYDYYDNAVDSCFLNATDTFNAKKSSGFSDEVLEKGYEALRFSDEQNAFLKSGDFISSGEFNAAKCIQKHQCYEQGGTQAIRFYVEKSIRRNCEGRLRLTHKPYIPAWFMGTCDYTWFVCLLLTQRFLPPVKSLYRFTVLGGDNIKH